MKKKLFPAVTLVEVLIAIYIFGIGILVILRMLISNISWLYDLRAKDTAVSL
jgi:Tfp pilus assembly protein PilV